MGMTIDESISILNYQKDWYELNKSKAIDVAIDTMRKYQKIEPKIKVLQHFTENTPLATQRMIRIINEIVEVLEDGNK